MPIRHYFCCMAIHRFLRACHHRLCHYQSHDRYVNPSFIPTASDSFRFLPPPLSRESRPGIAVAVTPSHTEGRGTKRQASPCSCGCTSVSTISAESTSSGKRVLPPTTSVRNSALASPPALREEGKGGGANGDIGIDMKPRHYVTFVLHMSNEDPPSQ